MLYIFLQVNPPALLADKAYDKDKIEQGQASDAEEHSPGLFCTSGYFAPAQAEIGRPRTLSNTDEPFPQEFRMSFCNRVIQKECVR